MERKKLELQQINSPVNLQLLFDEPLVGENKFGKYYMYAVKNGEEELPNLRKAKNDLFAMAKNIKFNQSKPN